MLKENGLIFEASWGLKDSLGFILVIQVQGSNPDTQIKKKGRKEIADGLVDGIKLVFRKIKSENWRIRLIRVI